MFVPVVEEAAALASISLFLGMLAVWAQCLRRCDGAPERPMVPVCGAPFPGFRFRSAGGHAAPRPGTNLGGTLSEEPVTARCAAACRWWTGAAGMRTITPGFARQP